jgi:hypothetical protein
VSDAGTALKNDTEIGVGGTIVMEAEAESDGLAAEAAVMVTVAPDGTAAGAVYVTAPL